jgi:hypothetical protein
LNGPEGSHASHAWDDLRARKAVFPLTPVRARALTQLLLLAYERLVHEHAAVGPDRERHLAAVEHLDALADLRAEQNARGDRSPGSSTGPSPNPGAKLGAQAVVRHVQQHQLHVSEGVTAKYRAK